MCSCDVPPPEGTVKVWVHAQRVQENVAHGRTGPCVLLMWPDGTVETVHAVGGAGWRLTSDYGRQPSMRPNIWIEADAATLHITR